MDQKDDAAPKESPVVEQPTADNSVWHGFVREARPISVHTGLVLLCILSVLLIGSGVRILKLLLAGHETTFASIESDELWVIEKLIWLYGGYILIEVSYGLIIGIIRGWKGVIRQWKK